jgi:hypothetical protein
MIANFGLTAFLAEAAKWSWFVVRDIVFISEAAICDNSVIKNSAN